MPTILCSSMDDIGKKSGSEGDGELPMSFLQQRIAEMQASEVLKDRRCAKNWSEGRCSTRVVAVLNDDWVRQVSQLSNSSEYIPTQPHVPLEMYAHHVFPVLACRCESLTTTLRSEHTKVAIFHRLLLLFLLWLLVLVLLLAASHLSGITVPALVGLLDG